ncbi:hypothetical protein [Alkalilimnicola ehrlichii]|nr:hypothetical protein [Alkalilimnicola ehrlichii]
MEIAVERGFVSLKQPVAGEYFPIAAGNAQRGGVALLFEMGIANMSSDIA